MATVVIVTDGQEPDSLDYLRDSNGRVLKFGDEEEAAAYVEASGINDDEVFYLWFWNEKAD